MVGCKTKCKNCNSDLYFSQQKDEFSFPTQTVCNVCSYTNIYYAYEVVQERYDYQCPFCKKYFFIRLPPPINVTCPHSKSHLYISEYGEITILQNGSLPSRESNALGGLIGGAAIGSLLGPAGAILGGLLGGALAYRGLTKEAIYQNGL